MKQLPIHLAQKLEQRQKEGMLRSLPTARGLVDFSSNDYLGFAGSRDIFDAAHDYLVRNGMALNGSGGSRLISGNHALYAVAEEIISRFHQSEAALIFNSGYDANVGLFSSIPQKGDVVLYDEYIHASIRDGIRMSNAQAFKFRHNDITHLEKLIGTYKNSGNEVYIATESVFSMDGDSPNLEAIATLAEQYGCRLIVDEAHTLGVFGGKGEGRVQALNLQQVAFARIMTFGKGLGCHGAAILGSKQLSDYLVNFSRSFIYTTALPPHSLATIAAAYSHLEASPSRQQLREIIAFFISEAGELGLEGFIASDSAIHCIVIPGVERVKAVAAHLQQAGFDVRPILSPTVPAGKERLRFCLHSFNRHEEVTGVLTTLQAALRG